ncbi:MAG: 2-keto-4-pentenoate hydratase [Acidimicrobiia bacterium]|nr:MAG: 2-keto-4-pentenoate hydratase [Acidimicrobiia bacterium]
MPVDVRRLATELHRARIDRRPIEPLTEGFGDLTLEEAYRIQQYGLSLRISEGERVVGAKLGFTSRAMQRAMGVSHPNYGVLTDAMLLTGPVPWERLIHPKVEPEIAFLIGEEIRPSASAFDVMAATEKVIPCLEVVDSRFIDFRFAALDNIADNSSAANFALGDPHPVDGLDLRLIGVVLFADGDPGETAAGAAVLDHPARAVAWLVNSRGEPLMPGQVVLSAGLTAPVDLRRGMEVIAEFDRLGSVRLTVE